MKTKTISNRPYIERINNSSGRKLAFNRYKKAVELLSGNSVALDCACGSGYGSSMLASAGKEVIGIDVSLGEVKHAKKTYGNEGCMFAQADAKALPFKDGSFDCTCSIETIEHMEKGYHGQFLNELKRTLKPNGMLVISTPNKGFIPYPTSGHVGELTEKEFNKLLSRSFGSVERFGQGIIDGSIVPRFLRFAKTVVCSFGCLDETRQLLPPPILSWISGKMRGNLLEIQRRELMKGKPLTFYSKCEKPK
jgi:ubiquinone/menaquinone biosynthesis C-methylase UbiE